MGGDGWNGGVEKKSTLSSLDWSKSNERPQIKGFEPLAESCVDNADGESMLDPSPDLHGFSTSLPALLRGKQSSIGRLEDSGLDAEAADEVLGPLDEELVSRAIGDILPGNEEELLAGITEGFDLMHVNSGTDENEDDLFSSGGGLEMDGETQEGLGIYVSNARGLDAFYAGGPGLHEPSSNGLGSAIGEHPYGEHPSRTLFVRNINSNVEDSELRSLFEQYGDIRSLYTSCKHRGFVMISYYDIRAARSAMRALQNKPLRRRKLDIHFSIPKDNPSDKDINQGTLVVFNLDASVSNEELRHIFGHYGEVKEIRETPHKRHHKFIEFYDARAAEAALRALNRSDIAGKRIKLEPSRPGGARRSLMQQLSLDPDQEDVHLFRQQSSPPVTNSPPGHLSSWGSFGSPVENGFLRTMHHSLGASVTKSLPGLPVPSTSSHFRVGLIGGHLGQNNQIDAGLSSISAGLAGQGIGSHHAHSLPEFSDGGMPRYSSPTPMPIRGSTHGPLDSEGLRLPRANSTDAPIPIWGPMHGPLDSEGLRLPRANSTDTPTPIWGPTHGPLDSEGLRLPRANSTDVSLFEHARGALGIQSSGSLRRMNSASAGSSSLTGPQFLWGSPSSYQQSAASTTWSNSTPVHSNYSALGMGHSQPFGGYTRNSRFVHSGISSPSHHVGSAPSGDPSFLDRHFTYFREPTEPSFFKACSVGPLTIPGRATAALMSLGGTHSGSLGNNGMYEGGSSPSLGMISPHRRHMFPSSGLMMGSYFDTLSTDRIRIRRTDSNISQADIKKQYQLDIERIRRGEDSRTTLMIKNIPNKYTAKMLLAAIDENHRGLYDFLYLPIDFKNKCNVGYAFINTTSPNHIIPIYQAFNGKKWEKFNSEKVASLAYARIQGKAALVAHFQNSSLMNEDKRCRPILFNPDGQDNSEQEPCFLEGVTIGRDQSGLVEFMEAPPPRPGIQDSFMLGSAGSVPSSLGKD